MYGTGHYHNKGPDPIRYSVLTGHYHNKGPDPIRFSFINGQYFYNNKSSFRVSTLKDFLDIYRAASREKKNIILSNLQTRLDSIKRYEAQPFSEEDIPF